MEKNSNITKKSWVIVSLCFLFFVFCFLLFVWQGIYLPKNPLGKEKIFAIGKGEGVREISFHLEKEGLIKSRLFFRIYVLSKGVSRNLQAGDYSLSPSMTIPEIAKKIVSGEVIKEKITILEGWNLRDIAYYFENKGISYSKEFLEITKEDFSKDFDFLKDKPKNLDLEGYLFPDTYYIQHKELEEIVKRMLENFDKKLTPELREEISRQGKTIFEIVTMASMLEKEVKTSEDKKDKKLVSGILWKRLENGIPLQVDATITFITGKKTTGISIEDLQIDSPYNTYKYKGLPLGPICNPGLDSILAAISPEESNFWYYLSTPEGETIFNKTLEKHNIAKEKYLK